MYNIYDLLRFHALSRPTAPLLILDSHTVTYAEAHKKTELFKKYIIEKGIQPGDHVAVSCSNIEDYVIAVLAIWGMGSVVAPIEPTLADKEIKTLLNISCANWIIESSTANGGQPTITALSSRFEQQQSPSARQAAQLLFTSGSSGIPKAVVLSHDSLIAAAIECADSISLCPADIQMTTVPFWHAYGQNRGMNATLFAGASIAPVFKDDLSLRIAAIKRIQPTVLLSMAGFYGFLAFSKQAIGDNLRVAVAGAAPLPSPVLKKFEEAYGVPLLTTYGLTEFLIISCQRLSDKRVPGTVGYPSRGVELRIVDENNKDAPFGTQGRIWVRGCLSMEGYLGLPDKKFFEDGWLDTEDIGILDESGLRVLGRVSSFIKRSGLKVYPIEIQNCLAEHPDVIDLAVAKFTNQLGTEDLIAEVVLKEDSETTMDDLAHYCSNHLPAYKVPAKFRQVSEIPRLPSGKPDLIRIGREATNKL